MGKRNDAISWDAYFMGLAHLSALRSKDPSTQVGATIVDGYKKIAGIGYNGLPNGLSDNEFSWAREGEFIETKYAYVVHAELNAILNATQSLRGCSLYVSLFPCNECAKAIAQAGIKEVVYEDDKYCETDGDFVSRKILSAAGVSFRKLSIPVSITLKHDQ